MADGCKRKISRFEYMIAVGAGREDLVSDVEPRTESEERKLRETKIKNSLKNIQNATTGEYLFPQLHDANPNKRD